MYKKIIQGVLIAAAIAVIGYVYYKFSSQDNASADSFEAVPLNVNFILEVNGFNELETYMPLLETMASHKNEMAGVSFNPISEWPDILNTFDSLRIKNETWMTVLQKSAVVIACSDQGRGDSWILSIGLKKGSANTEAEALMATWIKDIDTREFKNTKIHRNNFLQWAVIHDCLLLARSGSLIEDAVIRNEKNDLLKNNTAFIETRAITSKDVLVHFYSGIDNRDWLQLDPTFIDGQGSLSGYCLLNDSTHHSFQLTGEGKDFHIQNHLPDNTSILDVYSYTDFESGWSLHETFFEGTNASKFWGQAWKDFGDTCQCDLNEALLSWRSGEWGSAVIAINDSATAEVAFFGMKDSLDIFTLLRPVLIEQHVTPDHIYKVKYPALFERNQQQNVLIEANYIMQVGEYIFVAATPGELKHVVNYTSTLGATSSFQKAMKGMNHARGRFIYQTDYYTSSLPLTLIKAINGFDFIATSVEHFKDNKFLVHIALPFEQKSNLTSTVDVPQENKPADEQDILCGPWTVINHNTKEKETLIQTKNFEMCLIGVDQKILWKKKIEGKVLGEVIQIDVLKNGKLQMAFTTESGMHILDRNGNEVERFPYLPKPPITSPLHVADYDNTKKYRLLFALGDGAIENLGTDGKQTTGWKHQSENAVITYIDHFKIGNEDYIITASITGRIGLYKRTGEVKYTTSTQLSDYDGGKCSVDVSDKIETTSISYTTKSGEKKTMQIGK